eukprot:363132-Chlamydomonas_euryale.AAC.11
MSTCAQGQLWKTWRSVGEEQCRCEQCGKAAPPQYRVRHRSYRHPRHTAFFASRSMRLNK